MLSIQILNGVALHLEKNEVPLMICVIQMHKLFFIGCSYVTTDILD
jgi:hypothetical protein